MTRAIYVSPDPVAGPAKARALNVGWLAAPTPDLAGVPVPCAVVDGVGRQVFPEPITPSAVAAAIAAGIAADQAAASAQATLDGNAGTIRSRAQAALAANATFLAIASPTAAQVATQSKALTRQVDALIRLALDIFDSTADS